MVAVAFKIHTQLTNPNMNWGQWFWPRKGSRQLSLERIKLRTKYLITSWVSCNILPEVIIGEGNTSLEQSDYSWLILAMWASSEEYGLQVRVSHIFRDLGVMEGADWCAFLLRGLLYLLPVSTATCATTSAHTISLILLMFLLSLVMYV